MISVCLACDDNYSKYAGVLIASILVNADKSEELTFYILDGGISEEQKGKIRSLAYIKQCRINFVPIDNSMFDDYANIKTHRYISIATYYRLKLPTLLPEVKKIIYFDCDMVVNSSIAPLFNEDLKGCVLAGVKDINKRRLKKNPEYVNAGMLVMDIDAMKRENTEEKFLEYTKAHFSEIKAGDQDIINEVLKNKIKIVDDTWNVQSSNFTNRSSYTDKPKVIHYTAKRKPWHKYSFSYHKDYYFKYLKLTPWRLSEKEEKELKSLKYKIVLLLKYFKYRPLFMLRPQFYKALYYSYIKPFLK